MRLASVALVFALTLSPQASAFFSDDTAQYSVTFDATWSAATHPGAFPGGAHFSPLIGATHDSSVAFWTPGQVSSNGIESMAETGATGQLALEVTIAINSGQAASVITGGSLFGLPNSTTTSFSLGLAHPEVTLVTMIAPSPDWFIGVHGLSLFENGDWVDSKVVSLFPYDAGTDSGVNFNSGNANTNPPDPITALTGFPFAGAPALGTFTFTRTDDAADPWADLGLALAGTHGAPTLAADGSLCAGTNLTMTLENALENTVAFLAVGFDRIDAPFFGGVLVPDIVSPSSFLLGFGTGPSGTIPLATLWPTGLAPGVDIYAQYWIDDPGAPFGYAASNAVTATTP